MIDILPLAGMLFSLLMVMIIGGFILLIPLSKRLGQLMEVRLEQQKAGALTAEDTATLLETVHALQDQVERLAERQAFTERLLESGPHSREEAR